MLFMRILSKDDDVFEAQYLTLFAVCMLVAAGQGCCIAFGWQHRQLQHHYRVHMVNDGEHYGAVIAGFQPINVPNNHQVPVFAY